MKQNGAFQKKRIAIIGAGASGLASIKSCLEEGEFLEPICFEMSKNIGGLWYFNQEKPDQSFCKEDINPETGEVNHYFSSVYRSTIINTSREMMSFSDYPIDSKEYALFMHNQKVQKYLEEYGKEFDLLDKIRFETKVTQVDLIDSNTKKWRVKTEHVQTKEQQEEIFDGVMICTGHHNIPNLPSFPGIENFQGQWFHSHYYKEPSAFDDKRVLVVGIGNSAVDIAVELSRNAKQVYLSTRSGAWVYARTAFCNAPADHVNGCRLVAKLPFPVMEQLYKGVAYLQNGSMDNSPIKPKYGPLASHPTLNGELVGRITTGLITGKPNIRQIYEHSVEFEDDSVVNDIDVIIFCTGYKLKIPYLSEDVLKTEKNEFPLYKFVFLPQIGCSLACIGFIQPLGAIFPISELQARWYCQLNAHGEKYTLPSVKAMNKDIAFKRYEMKNRYKSSERHTIQVDYRTYMDEVGEMFGVKPNFKELYHKYGPELVRKLIDGPLIPQHYRLNGPHANPSLAIAEIEHTYWPVLQFTQYEKYTQKAGKYTGRANPLMRCFSLVMAYAVIVLYIILCIIHRISCWFKARDFETQYK